MNKFKIGNWVCDKGHQDSGIKIIRIKENGKLICNFPSDTKKEIEVDPKHVEIWKKKNKK